MARAGSWESSPYPEGRTLERYSPGSICAVDDFIEHFHGHHEQTREYVAASPTVICALLRIPALIQVGGMMHNRLL